MNLSPGSLEQYLEISHEKRHNVSPQKPSKGINRKYLNANKIIDRNVLPGGLDLVMWWAQALRDVLVACCDCTVLGSGP